MKNYLELLQDIKDNGVVKGSRSGKTTSVFGRSLRWDLSEGFPALTTRRVPLRFAFEETWFFLSGSTDTTILADKNIPIWEGNTTREFLDDKGLTDLPVGSLGTGYSHQWRNFGGAIGGDDGIDQITELVEGLKNDPNSRRHIVSGWNPKQLDGTPLPPCHVYNQYYIAEGKLHSTFMMRSTDVPFGLPFNMMGYALLNMAIAKLLGLEAGDLVYFGNDVHIYEEQMPMVDEMLQRTPDAMPTLIIKKDLKTIDDLLSMEYNDIELKDYAPQPDIKNKPKMAV